MKTTFSGGRAKEVSDLVLRGDLVQAIRKRAQDKILFGEGTDANVLAASARVLLQLAKDLEKGEL
jgi:hypothetical protein